ncbi:MAG: transcriptional repressor [Candidatus Actinomarina sp.]|jgi:Fur family ferric uptake transcriptional regulator|nr:transcriptional repressor [Candidatus Actinomarina sp.]MBL6762947.1 transcriptional repressor [Candidatus Actinomarina sp.]MBL6836160.1 transcriptional repressor [Candidatus Actinomarina sp.]
MEKSSREILSDNNISITNPRIIVLEQLLKYKKPISVEDLQDNLRGQVATSTLYRVLNDLKKINVISEFITPGNTTMIELSLHEDEHHHHLFCKSCGDVIDIELSLGFEQKLSSEIKSIEKNSFFIIEDHGLELIGRCSECRDSF